MTFCFHHILLFWGNAMHGFQFIDHIVGDTWSQHLCPFMSISLVIDHHPDQGRGAGLVSLYPVYESGWGGSLMSSWCYLPRTYLCTHMCVCTTRLWTMVHRLPLSLHRMAMSRQCACWQSSMLISIRWLVSVCCMDDGNRPETDGCDGNTHSHAQAQICGQVCTPWVDHHIYFNRPQCPRW